MADETEREALAPCPFCGGEPRVEHTYVGEGYDVDFHMVARICCPACQIGGSYTDAPDQGASRWNRRVGVSPSRHRAEVEAAREAGWKAYRQIGPVFLEYFCCGGDRDAFEAFARSPRRFLAERDE